MNGDSAHGRLDKISSANIIIGATSWHEGLTSILSEAAKWH